MARVRDLHLETRAVVHGRPADEPDAPLNVPVTLTSTFVAGGPTEYARYGNPSWSALEETLGGLEGGTCLAFASGMAAAVAILEQVPHGGRVVVPRHAYQGVLGLLATWVERGRVQTTPVDVTDLDAIVAAVPGSALVWMESPTNPALEVVDIAAVAVATRAAGVPLVVDNTFATPLLQRPLDDGADVVLHSATKLLSGHSDVIMGATVTRDEAWQQRLLQHRSMHGAIPGPFEAYLVLRGIRTLAVRLERAQSTATLLAERLAAHPVVTAVRHPGFGTVLGIELADAAAADAVVAAARLVRHATSLGGVESTFERRRRWATESPTIPEGLIRLSVGIEHPDDLVADLERALDAAR